jgi:hypothetical protein
MMCVSFNSDTTEYILEKELLLSVNSWIFSGYKWISCSLIICILDEKKVCAVMITNFTNNNKRRIAFLLISLNTNKVILTVYMSSTAGVL